MFSYRVELFWMAKKYELATIVRIDWNDSFWYGASVYLNNLVTLYKPIVNEQFEVYFNTSKNECKSPTLRTTVSSQ